MNVRHRLGGRAVAAALAAVVVAGAAPVHAHDIYGGYRHDYRSGSIDRFDTLRLRQDLARLREQLRTQEFQFRQQLRRQEEQLRLLRQQSSAQHQGTARQACLYRYSAGVELCAALFDPDSAEHASCRATVNERNPGCADDDARVARPPG